jgi:hypothetical protein
MISASTRSLAVLVAALAVGCAAVDDKIAVEPKAQREYRTGSNIPVHDPKPVTEEERARAVEQARDMQRNSAATKQ